MFFECILNPHSITLFLILNIEILDSQHRTEQSLINKLLPAPLLPLGTVVKQTADIAGHLLPLPPPIIEFKDIDNARQVLYRSRLVRVL
jgi:hypothetical protein